MQENNPNITQPRWMTDAQRADFNQTASDLYDSRQGEALANEHVKKLYRLASVYLTDDQQSTFRNGLADLMGDTFSAYKGDL